MARRECVISFLLPLLLSGDLAAQTGGLLFVPGEPQVLSPWRGAGPLGRLDDQEAALALPGKSGCLETRKFLPLGALQAFRGDPEGRGDYTTPFVVGEIDALHAPGGMQGGAPAPKDLYLSVTRRCLPVFDGARTRNLGPADVFRWRGKGEVQVFLEASLLEKALGFRSPSLDLDALCVDGKGNLYFSLALDEPYPNPRVRDGDLCFLPAGALTLRQDGTVKDVKPGSVILAAREADLDAWVAASGLASSSGVPLKKVGNLSCLAMDPGGGTFAPPAAPSMAPLPNLLFGGSGRGWAMGLCSTSGKGSLGRFGGVELGSRKKTTGAHLGVESLSGGPSDSWVCALALCVPPVVRIQVEERMGGRFLKPVPALTFYWAGVEPGRAAFLLLAPGPGGPGGAFPSMVLPPSPLGGPWEVFWGGGPAYLLPLGLAGPGGRGRTVQALPSSLSGPLLLAAQVLGPVGGGKLDLSLPLVLQWW